MVAIAIPMSLSRSAFLGLLIGSVVLLSSWSWKRRLRAIGWGAVFAVIMRFLIPGLLGTIKSLFTGLGSDPSIQGRTDDFSQVGYFIGQAPFFGRGFGTFLPKRYFFLDNQYLGSIIETGFIGFGALLLLFIVGIFTARGARRHSEDEERRHLNNALAASLLTIMVGFVTFDGFGFPMIDGVMFFLIGCAGGQWRLTHKEEGRPQPPEDEGLALTIVPGPRVVLRPPPQAG
jgi:O-antigen ligase